MPALLVSMFTLAVFANLRFECSFHLAIVALGGVALSLCALLCALKLDGTANMPWGAALCPAFFPLVAAVVYPGVCAVFFVVCRMGCLSACICDNGVQC